MDIKDIVDKLNKGYIGITPTDTVYGIMGDATKEDVIKRVFNVKKRDYNNPLLMLVSDIDMLKEYIYISNDIEKKLIDKYWPGRTTLILKKKDNVSNLLTGNRDNVGVRIPDNKELLDIIKLFGKPVISTSANISGSDTITSVDQIEEELKHSVDFIVDGGILDNKGSTIVYAIDNELKILRDGDLSSKIKEDF